MVEREEADEPEATCQASFSGTKTEIPDYDICRLAFYLKCCVLGCGLDPTVHPELLDYGRAHHLPLQAQQCIFQLALRKFNPEALVNRAYFVDDCNVVLPPPISNAFYEIEAVSSNFPVPRQISVFGQPMPVTKVMLCTSAWINEIYIQSVRRLQQSLANAFIGNAIEGNGTFHCSHCRGVESNCTCDQGCPHLDGVSACHVIHFGYACHGCGMRDIRGFRYRCLVCPGDCNICKYCYENGVHDQTHSFERFVRMGFPSQVLNPQATPSNDTEDAPVAVALPVD